jgi:D-alanine--poly(phosphoribitol) ligase subunit 2
VNLDAAAIEAAIKTRIIAIAEQLGDDANDLQPDEVIPTTGLIDSAGLLELIAWFESHYDFSIPPADLTIDNLGSMRDMARYLRHRKGLA